MTPRDWQLPRIVVAEDAQSMRDLIVLVLQHHGFDAVGVADGDAALKAILDEGADGLVSDLNMPGLDGLTLGRVLRALRACAALPIVVFTGVEAEDPRLEALRSLGNVSVLSKPNGLRAIAPALDEMLASPVAGLAAIDLSDVSHSPVHRLWKSDPGVSVGMGVGGA